MKYFYLIILMAFSIKGKGQYSNCCICTEKIKDSGMNIAMEVNKQKNEHEFDAIKINRFEFRKGSKGLTFSVTKRLNQIFEIELRNNLDEGISLISENNIKGISPIDLQDLPPDSEFKYVIYGSIYKNEGNDKYELYVHLDKQSDSTDGKPVIFRSVKYFISFIGVDELAKLVVTSLKD